MNKAFVRGFLFFVVLAFVWSTPGRTQVYVNGFETTGKNRQWLNSNGLYDSDAYDGNHIHRTFAEMEYGCGLEVPFSDSLVGKNLQIRIDAAFRLRQLPTSALFVITIHRGDSMVYWHGLSLKDEIRKTNRWTRASTSFSIPSDIVNGSKLKMYLWNPGMELIDTDALSLQIESIAMPVYIPKISKTEHAGIAEILFKNEFYHLLFYKKSGSVLIADIAGEPITFPLALISGEKKRNRVKNVLSDVWSIKSAEKLNEFYRITLVSNNKISTDELCLTAKVGNSELQCQLVSTFNRGIKLNRHSLAIWFTDSVSKVYRKNALLDESVFQDEYYIDKQGVTFGKEKRQTTIYHLNDISSGQVSVNEKLLLLNLDYAPDHPQLYFPLLKRKSDVFRDISDNEYSKDDTLYGRFNISIGSTLKNLPRIMPVPSGYEAAIIWTEHADWTDMRTHRAVNFGREDILNIEEAVGGFAKYEIPVTKSVFYHNPDNISNELISKGSFKGWHATIKSDTAFLPFLKQLNQAGFEICLHTPEQFTSNRQFMDEALGFMQTEFGSPTWIDHGYNNNPSNNRENVACDGFNIDSPQFAADLFRKYGIRNFWNPYYEDVRPYDAWHFYGNLIFPYPGFGDCFPDRMISRNPRRFDGILWSTGSSLELKNPSLWNYFFDTTRLLGLLNYHSVYINHVYPAWVDKNIGFWTKNADGDIVASEPFNQALSRIHALHLAGRLLPLTMGEFLNYQESVQQISYSIQNDGSILIENNNINKINGLSFITKSKSVTVNGKMPSSKSIKDELIFWFDLEAGEKVIIVSDQHD
jgi:hypothetical protein